MSEKFFFNKNQAEADVRNEYDSQLLLNQALKRERIARESSKVMDDFLKQGIYSTAEIEADKKKIEQNEKRPEYNKEKIGSEDFEFIIKQAEYADWWGKDCHVSRASKYDDMFNGTDLVFEWENEEGDPAVFPNNEPMRLAVDCTVNPKRTEREEKSDKVVKSLFSGKMTSLKYFESDFFDHDLKKNEYVPRVILAIDSEEKQKLFETFLKNDDFANPTNKEFQNCYFQLSFFEEIKEQLEKQREIIGRVKRKNKDHAIAKKNIEAVLGKIKDTYEIKQKTLDKSIIQSYEKTRKNMPNMANLY